LRGREVKGAGLIRLKGHRPDVSPRPSQFEDSDYVRKLLVNNPLHVIILPFRFSLNSLFPSTSIFSFVFVLFILLYFPQINASLLLLPFSFGSLSLVFKVPDLFLSLLPMVFGVEYSQLMTPKMVGVCKATELCTCKSGSSSHHLRHDMRSTPRACHETRSFVRLGFKDVRSKPEHVVQLIKCHLPLSGKTCEGIQRQAASGPQSQTLRRWPITRD
jgi:hypothetical protein